MKGCGGVKAQRLTPVQDVIRYRLRRGSVLWVGCGRSPRDKPFTAAMACGGLEGPSDGPTGTGAVACRMLTGAGLHEGDILQPVACPWWERRHRWHVECTPQDGWSIHRNSPLRGWLRGGHRRWNAAPGDGPALSGDEIRATGCASSAHPCTSWKWESHPRQFESRIGRCRCGSPDRC